MERLDGEASEAQVMDTPRVTSSEIAESLADLQTLFADAEPATKHRIVQALFEQVEVLGPNEVWLYPSVEAEARGWASAMSGEFRVELRQTGRGERRQATLRHLNVPANLPLEIEVTGAERWTCANSRAGETR